MHYLKLFVIIHDFNDLAVLHANIREPLAFSGIFPHDWGFSLNHCGLPK